MQPTPSRATLERQLRSGGWSYFGSQQSSVEATSLAVMAFEHGIAECSSIWIRSDARSAEARRGWPASLGTRKPVGQRPWRYVLNGTGEFTSAREKAFHWLVAERGREAHWLWRWKFKTTIATFASIRTSMAGLGSQDPQAGSSPRRSASWPSSNSRSAIVPRRRRNESIWASICFWIVRASTRLELWNSVVYGVPLRPIIEATAIALLALQDERRSEVIQEVWHGWTKEAPASFLFPALRGVFSPVSCTKSPLSR